MPQVIDGQFAGRIEGDFVVFLIGMRINKPWKLGQWLPVFLAMPKLVKELERAGPDSGFLGHTGLSLRVMVQYWRSFDHLERYARSKDHQHWPAWVAFNRRIRGARGDVGIWHETYLVRAGEYESVYSGMPRFGLSKAAGHVQFGKGAEGGSAARDRLAGRLA
ncbi:MAG TPA: DUF4188 domain-containing protein [Paracoccaceae bacterium]|nr:DUF4188 domain-containing protein [Paracoccaceae bacterium]HMO71144.1 DUF4188 domain-containing protein [Paracoccaceae bacterium]